MAFWLADRRDGQQSDWIQRFDPRFWTVDFPRPMMASVVTTGADSLRVELEFHHANALAGLIWESADRFDHPLLAYDTDRDYSRTTLAFRWRCCTAASRTCSWSVTNRAASSSWVMRNSRCRASRKRST